MSVPSGDGGAWPEAGSPQHRAFLEATMPHLDAVYRVARHVSRDPQLAEDLVQETYLRAYAAFSSHRGEHTKAWLTSICLNLARSDWRRRARRPIEELTAALGEGEESPGSAGDEVAAAAQANMERQVVTEALRRLSPEQAQAIVLMDLAGHTAAEVAAMLNCPRGTVLARAHRGRRKLAQLLRERGGHRDVL